MEECVILVRRSSKKLKIKGLLGNSKKVEGQKAKNKSRKHSKPNNFNIFK